MESDLKLYMSDDEQEVSQITMLSNRDLPKFCSIRESLNVAYRISSGFTDLIDAYAKVCIHQDIKPSHDDIIELIGEIEGSGYMNFEEFKSALKMLPNNPTYKTIQNWLDQNDLMFSELSIQIVELLIKDQNRERKMAAKAEKIAQQQQKQEQLQQQKQQQQQQQRQPRNISLPATQPSITSIQPPISVASPFLSQNCEIVEKVISKANNVSQPRNISLNATQPSSTSVPSMDGLQKPRNITIKVPQPPSTSVASPMDALQKLSSCIDVTRTTVPAKRSAVDADIDRTESENVEMEIHSNNENDEIEILSDPTHTGKSRFSHIKSYISPNPHNQQF